MKVELDKSIMYQWMSKNVGRKIPWYKTSLRWMIVVGLVYYLFPLGGFPLFSTHKMRPKPEASQGNLEAETGMGGMAYSDSSLPEGLSFGNASLDLGTVIGIPEPEEFSKPELLLYTSYEIQSNETIGSIAQKFGLNQDTIISMNGITNARLIRNGQTLRIPNQDGLIYHVKNGDTLSAIARKFDVSMQTIQTVNELFSDALQANTDIFIPGAKLDLMELQEISGDLFAWPVRGYITSNYGYRASPFTGQGRQFHSGLDIGVPMGTPIKAAMSGRVAIAGYDRVYGNYVVISHHSGYRTLYGHMSVIRTKPGAYVGTGERIGDAGSTGMSTGPHLHFTVYKNGVTVNPRPLIK
ncbi:MAG: M23 family metallopeptidase [Treponema sp.]|jgi:murein DD-endopeptidase MepM/ murein hydrolase activator NlpD|nr:M23 family metallopeptidase [Treponema sp.]